MCTLVVKYYAQVHDHLHKYSEDCSHESGNAMNTVVHWAFCAQHVHNCAVVCAEKLFCAEMQPMAKMGNWCKIAQNSLSAKQNWTSTKLWSQLGHCVVAVGPYKASQIVRNVTPSMPRGTFQWKCQNWLLHIKLLLVVKTKAALLLLPLKWPFLQFLVTCNSMQGSSWPAALSSPTPKKGFLWNVFFFSRNQSWKAKFCHDFDPCGSIFEREKWSEAAAVAALL